MSDYNISSYERGHADAVEFICRLANHVLDGKDDGKNTAKEPWQSLRKRLLEIREAVVNHHSQKADDRCWLDDDLIYNAFGLQPVDRHVGDKAAMLDNCRRFINKRCFGGKWRSYAELETALHANRCHPDYIYTIKPPRITEEVMKDHLWERNPEYQVLGEECWRHKFKTPETP